MAEITRETLELAALAAGVIWIDEGGKELCVPSVYRDWNPHLDDGDAARLADKLLMHVDSRGTAVQARVVGAASHRVERDGNPSAWREAVVLCAAAVGERMQKGWA